MSEPLLDRLLTDIEYEASTVDPWETNSSRSSTIRGIGSLAGRGIMAVGIGILRRVDVVTVRSAVTKLSEYQWDQDSALLPMQAYKDMLEYQRPGLYARDVNIAAWDLMLVHLNRRNAQIIVECLFQPEWSRTDVQIFIKQLAACTLTDWKVYPHGNYAAPLSTVASNLNYELDERRAVRLHAGLCRILFLLLGTDPSLIHEVFDVGELAVILGKTILTSLREPSDTILSPTAYVLRGSGSWISHGRIGIMTNYRVSIEILEVFVVSFLPTASTTDLQDAAQCIMDALQTFITDYDIIQKSTNPLTLGSDTSAISPLPALRLAVMLATQRKELSVFLLELGVVQALEKLWLGPSYLFYQDHRDQCLQLLGALTVHNPVDHIAERIASFTKPCFFIDDDEDLRSDSKETVLQYRFQNLSTSDATPSYGESLLELALAVIHLSSTGAPRQPPLPPSKPSCHFLMDVILKRCYEPYITPAIRARACREFLNIALSPSQEWPVVIKLLVDDDAGYNDNDDNLSSALLTADYIVREYICGGSFRNPVSIPESIAEELKAMYRKAQSFGYLVCNPAERLTQLLLSGAGPSPSKRRSTTSLEAALKEWFPGFPSFSTSTRPLIPIWMAVLTGLSDFVRDGEPLSKDEQDIRHGVLQQVKRFTDMSQSPRKETQSDS